MQAAAIVGVVFVAWHQESHRDSDSRELVQRNVISFCFTRSLEQQFSKGRLFDESSFPPFGFLLFSFRPALLSPLVSSVSPAGAVA